MDKSRIPVAISWLLLGMLLLGPVVTKQVWDKDSDATKIFDRERLVAWCIVPFDARKRSPSQRAEMVTEIGMKRVA